MKIAKQSDKIQENDEDLLLLSRRIGEALRGRGIKLKTAESFTGGAISSAIIMTEGASEYFDEGFVCYSSQAKTKRLGVKTENLNAFGAVSLPVLKDMLKGLLDGGADVAAATTGNAGPAAQNGTVGECYVGAANHSRITIKKLLFKNDTGKPEKRQDIILKGTKEALKAIVELITL